MKNKRLLLSFCLAFTSFTLFAQEELQTPAPESEKSVLRIVENRQAHNLNPHTTSYSADSAILDSVYESLFALDPQSTNPVPALAVSYSVSRDKLRWTFTLREDALFSDGSKITSEDVKSSWIQLLATPNAPYSSLLDVVVGAKAYRLGQGNEEDVGIYATGPYKLLVKLTEPVPYLPSLISHYTFAVIHRNPTVYSGAYYLDDYNSEVVVLKKNPYYWDADNVSIPTVEFYQSFGADDNTYAYNTGLVDWLFLSDINQDKLIVQADLKLSAQFGTEFLFFRTKNVKKVENVWDRSDFRLALLEALPWDVLRENSYFPATTFVPQLTQYPKVTGFSYSDLEQAKVMMADARKNAGLSPDEKIPLRMELNQNTLNVKQEKAIVEVCQELGINVQIVYKPFAQYMASLETSSADIAGYSWIGDYADPLAFLDLFKSDSTMNSAGWKNEQFDELISQSSLETDTEERYKILAKAEQILLDDGMVIPICTPLSASIINTSEIGGWYPNLFNSHPLKYLYFKKKQNSLPNVVKK